MVLLDDVVNDIYVPIVLWCFIRNVVISLNVILPLAVTEFQGKNIRNLCILVLTVYIFNIIGLF